MRQIMRIFGGICRWEVAVSYSTNDELLKDISEEVLIQLTDDIDAREVNWITVGEKRADADALIDSYCANRYALPFNPVPRIIAKLSKEITVYNLYNRRLGAPEHLQTQHKANIKLLEAISSGGVQLGGADAPEPTADPGLTVKTTRQQFTPRRFKDF